MRGVVQLVIVVALGGLCTDLCLCRQFCDTNSMDSVFNFGHLVYFLRCGQIWTYDPRMNGGAGGFLRDWSLHQLARKYLWRAEDNLEDFRFSVFSFQEIHCFVYGEDLAESCYNSVKQWQHLTVLFTNHSVLTFRYETEYVVVNKDNNPLNFSAIQELKASEFWPQFPRLNPLGLPENYLSALYDPHLQVLFLALKYNLKYMITYVEMKEPIHNIKPFLKSKQRFNESWSQPFVFNGHLVGMFFDEKTNQSYVVGEVLRQFRLYNDQIYVLSRSDGRVVVHQSPIGMDFENLRTHFGCKYNNKERDDYFERRKRVLQTNKNKREGAVVRTKRCESQDIETEYISDDRIDYLTRISNDPKVLISLSIVIVILSIILFYLYSNPNPKLLTILLPNNY